MIRKDAEKKLKPFLKAAKRDAGDIKYSWDNDKIHKGADLATVGIADDMRLELPALSSDMHKVIEHVHGRIDNHFQKWLWGFKEGKPKVAECKRKVMEIFQTKITQESIMNDVHSLHVTYRAIVKAKGGYIVKTLR